jgi:hypothetical protein
MTYYIKPINIYGYLTDDPTALKNLETIVVQVKNTSENINAVPYLLLVDVVEGRIYNDTHDAYIENIRSILKNQGVRYQFILDGDFESESKISKLHKDIVYVNFFAAACYAHTLLSPNQRVNQKWNNKSSMGLYLPGQPDRPHRIKLIAMMWEKKLLNKLNYSFFITDLEKNSVFNQNLLSYDKEKFDRFLNETLCSLDIIAGSEDSFNYTGYPFDHRLYSNTLFSVISESDFKNESNWKPKLTEKTYRAMVNKHPFICAWFPGMTTHIENLGFKSFKEYMYYPNYNDEPDLIRRLKHTIKNIETFSNQVITHVDKIRDDVEFNYNHFVSLAKSNARKIELLLDKPQLPQYSVTLTDIVSYFFPLMANLVKK